MLFEETKHVIGPHYTASVSKTVTVLGRRRHTLDKFSLHSLGERPS